MKHIALAATICAVFMACAHRNASALVEYCPASMSYAAVGPADKPSDLYGVELAALGPRTVTTAILAFDTSAGWFDLGLQNVPLAEKDRHYSGPTSSFVHHDYVSPVVYVQFPQPVTIARAWVYGAAAQDNGAFGWQSQGTVACDPPPTSDSHMAPTQAELDANSVLAFGLSKQSVLGTVSVHLNAADVDHLGDPPSLASPMFGVSPSKPLLKTDCANPFQPAAIKTGIRPRNPNSSGIGQNEVENSMSEAAPLAGDAGLGTSQTYASIVEVAIDANGKVRDSWIWGPSGSKPFDQEALRAAGASTYVPAQAYCQPVPSFLYFDAKFLTN